MALKGGQVTDSAGRRTTAAPKLQLYTHQKMRGIPVKRREEQKLQP